MATLYLARRHGAAGFSRPIAIKVIHPHLASDPQFVSMFVDEALLTGRIDHPHVVRVDELGEHEDTYYLAMEYVHGCSLGQLLKALRRTERRVSPELGAALAVRVADGLHAAHELRTDDGGPANVVHRDVSPANVLLGYRGEVKLIDFGVAKAAGRAHTATGTLKGKIAYMSPEQATGNEVDRRSDIYALGVVLWEMLTTRRLFDGPSDMALLAKVRDPKVVPPSAYAPDVPAELDLAVLAALQQDPNGRPPTAQHFRQMLIASLPGAATVDGLQISGVVRTVMASSLQRERKVLPSSMFRTLPSMDAVTDTIVSKLIRPKLPDELDPTVPLAQALPDSQVAAANTKMLSTDTTIPTGTTIPTHIRSAAAAPDPGRRRLVIGGAIVLLVGALGAIGYAATSAEAGGSETPTMRVVEPLPPPPARELEEEPVAAPQAEPEPSVAVPDAGRRAKRRATRMRVRPRMAGRPTRPPSAMTMSQDTSRSEGPHRVSMGRFTDDLEF